LLAPRVPMPKDAPVIPSPSIPAYPTSPPDTPEASHSASTSPASSVSPQTPPDAHGPGFVNVKVVSADSSPVEAPVIPHGHGTLSSLAKPAKAVASTAPTSSAVASQKPKTAHGQFAYATRAVW
jgi:hypothetical protein